jgi:mannose/cellobiose epimerase-like protein (N-acyl-D-glucosamine 2-epimerase family)
MRYSQIVFFSLFFIALISIMVLAYRLGNRNTQVVGIIENFRSNRRKKYKKHHHHRRRYASSSSSSSDDDEPMPYKHDVLYGYKINIPGPGDPPLSFGGGGPSNGWIPENPIENTPEDTQIIPPIAKVPSNPKTPEKDSTSEVISVNEFPPAERFPPLSYITTTYKPKSSASSKESGLGAAKTAGTVVVVDEIALKIKTQIQGWLKSVYSFWSTVSRDTDGSFPAIIDGTGKKAAGKPGTAATDDGLGQKTLIQQARYLWFFSAYSSYKSSPESLAIAKSVKDYILKKKTADKLIPYALDTAPPDQRIHLYSLYFAIYGLAAYGIAAKSTPAESAAAKAAALDIFNALQKKFMYPPNSTNPVGYMVEGAAPEGEPITDKNEGSTKPLMSFNAVMHGIEAFTELYKATQDVTVGTRLRMLMDLLINKLFVPTEFRILNYCDPTSANSLSLPNAGFIDYGHNIEMAFLMDFAVTALGLTGKDKDKYMTPMINLCKSMLKQKKAWDETLKTVKDHNDANRQNKKDWWTQFEVMAACEWMYRSTQDQEYRKMLKAIIDFVTTHFWADLGGGKGEFYSAIENKGGKWESTGANKNIASNWKSNYHVGRTLILLDQWLATVDTSTSTAASTTTTTTSTEVDTATCTAMKLIDSKHADYEKMKNFASNRRIVSIKPKAFIIPKDEAELASIIKCANKANIKWTIRNGGHSYEGFSQLHDGYVIDLQKLVGVKVNPDNTVVVGAGEMFGHVYSEVAAKNLYIPAGTGPNVGVSGVTLGGGIGYATRKRGVTCNSVISARVVTAEGEIKVLSDKGDGSDLMEALRGGGPFYAVVTQWTFEAYPIPFKSYIYKLEWGSGEENAKNPLTQKIAADVLRAFVKGNPHLAPDKYTLIELFHGFGKVTLVIHYYQEKATDPAFTEPDFVAKMKAASPPNANSGQVKEFTKWIDYIVDITDLEGGGLSKWTKDNLTLEALRTRTMTKADKYTASSLLFNATMPPTDVHINKLTQTALGRYQFFYQFRAFGANSGKSSRPSSWPHSDSTMECQIYAIDNETISDSQKVIADLSTLAVYGHYYNYTYSGITSFASYFPDAKIAQKLVAVKSKYDRKNRILQGTAGSPIPTP